MQSNAASSWFDLRFSIRELLIAIAGVGCVLTGFVNYGEFGAAVIATALGGLLVIYGRRTETPRIARVGWYVLIPSFCISGAIFGLGALFGLGPIYSRVAWPYGLERMAKIGEVASTDVKLYGLGRFIDSEYAWRIRIDSNKLNATADDLGLTIVPARNVPREFWRVFPRLWEPKHEPHCLYLSTPNFPVALRGDDGDHFLAQYDPQTELLYVWCKSNF